MKSIVEILIGMFRRATCVQMEGVEVKIHQTMPDPTQQATSRVQATQDLTQQETPRVREVPRQQEELVSTKTTGASTTLAQAASVKTTESSTILAQPKLVKEPDDLGTPDLPRPDDVPWLSNEQKTAVAIEVIRYGRQGMEDRWTSYYQEGWPVEAIIHTQEQVFYDYFWHDMRECWKILRHPFWSAYIAGHFPNPQAVSGSPELVKEICVRDVEELKYRQIQSLIEDGVYTLGTLRNSLFNDHWCPQDISDRDKWYFRKVLLKYGLEVPPSDEPDPIPFAELYIGAVFGVEVTPERRLRSYDFIRGDESFEHRVRRIQDNYLGLHIDECEDVLFYLLPENNYGYGRVLKWALQHARRDLQVKKILAGGDYPEARSSLVEGVDLDELEKIAVEDLEGLSSNAKRRVQEYFWLHESNDVTLADLVREYHDWLLNDDTWIAIELKEYLYQHKYVIRPEEMPMDERTPVAYLGLPTRIRIRLRSPAHVETVDDLVRCCMGNDPVFSFRDMEGIGKRFAETIKDRLTELGFLTDSQ